MTKKQTNSLGQPVLVTTEHRGVFFGYHREDRDGPITKAQLTIINARNCVSWDTGVRGFLGLAESGPGRHCRIGRPAPRLTLFDITSVAACTDSAVEAWEAAPWNG